MKFYIFCTALDKQAQLGQKIKMTKDALKIFRKLEIPESYVIKARKTYNPENIYDKQTTVPDAFLILNGHIQSALIRTTSQLEVLVEELKTTNKILSDYRKSRENGNKIEIVTPGYDATTSELFTEIQREVINVEEDGKFEKLIKEMIGGGSSKEKSSKLGVSVSASGVFIMSVVCVMLITALAGILIYMRQKGKQLDRLDPNYYGVTI